MKQVQGACEDDLVTVFHAEFSNTGNGLCDSGALPGRH